MSKPNEIEWDNAFTMKTPCDNCPFRREGGIRIYRERARDILEDSTHFPCHKTVNYDAEPEPEPDSESGKCTSQTKTCAGYMILQFREGKPNQILQIASRIGLLDLDELLENNPAVDEVFESYAEMLTACESRD